MLQLRPVCEHCNISLPSDSTDAMICSFECTFCRGCVEKVLLEVCPNCGGNFVPRPIRPQRNYKHNNWIGTYPAVTKEIHKKVDVQAHMDLIKRVRQHS